MTPPSGHGSREGVEGYHPLNAALHSRAKGQIQGGDKRRLNCAYSYCGVSLLIAWKVYRGNEETAFNEKKKKVKLLDQRVSLIV